MKIKIFQAFGKEGIEKLETQINGWLKGQSGKTEIINTHVSAAAGMSVSPQGERFQTLVVCVWYESSN